MEKRETFLQRIEKPKSSKQYLQEELAADINIFPEKVRPSIRKIIGGEGAAIASNKKEINKWWQDKYGFPFDLKTERAEVLMRKYAAPETAQTVSLLQKELLRAIKSGNEIKITEIKKRYETEFPDQLEGVEVLFGFREFIIKQKAIDEAKEKKDYGYAREKSRFQDLTEYQFLFTHFILENSNDKEFLNDFWEVAEQIGGQTKSLKKMHMLHRGVITQVAAFKIFEQLGEKPKLSHPSEDAFNAIDLWADSGAIQIKGYDEEVPAVVETDHIAFPAVQTQEGEAISFWNTNYLKKEISRFQAKIRNYGKSLGKEINGHMLVIPYSKIDFITGEPAPELVEFFKGELEKDKNNKGGISEQTSSTLTN